MSKKAIKLLNQSNEYRNMYMHTSNKIYLDKSKSIKKKAALRLLNKALKGNVDAYNHLLDNSLFKQSELDEYITRNQVYDRQYKKRIRKILLAITIILLLMLLLICINADKLIKYFKTEKTYLTTIFEDKDNKNILYSNEIELMLRNAIYCYYLDYNRFPDSLNDLLKGFPVNYLSSIPVEPLSNINSISDTLNGLGGWYYNPNAGAEIKDIHSRIEQIFSKNIKETESIPFSPLVITIDKASNSLYIGNNDVLLRKYSVCLGKDDSTIEGVFSIKRRFATPLATWPTDENPYGTRALELSDDLYAIHGTNNPDSIGKNLSAGCIRLLNEDIEELFAITSIGTQVNIVKDLSSENQSSNMNDIYILQNKKSNTLKSNKPKMDVETSYQNNDNNSGASNNNSNNNNDEDENNTGNSNNNNMNDTNTGDKEDMPEYLGGSNLDEPNNPQPNNPFIKTQYNIGEPSKENKFWNF